MSILHRMLIVGNVQCRRSFITSLVRLTKDKDKNESSTSSSSSSSSSSDDSDSSSDDEKKLKNVITPKVASHVEATKKLNALLEAMIKEEPKEFDESKLNLAKPREKQREKHLREKAKKIDHKKFGEELAGAATEVAKDLGGDVQQTEAELLTRLLYKGKTEDVESTPTSDADKKKDVRKKIGSFTLNELLSGMKIDRSQPMQSVSNLVSRADQVRSVLGKGKSRTQIASEDSTSTTSRLRAQTVGERVNIFGSEPLNIFKTEDLNKGNADEIKLKTWECCYNRELNLAITQPPKNIYEQMILWTNNGMIWHFPIDNEQGLEEEKKVPFYDHIHMERHLEGWCPEAGPIRHFMELVCVGLSKNPWLTVEEKLDHIWWFRDYFGKKAKLIREIGAGEIKIESKKSIDI